MHLYEVRETLCVGVRATVRATVRGSSRIALALCVSAALPFAPLSAQSSAAQRAQQKAAEQREAQQQRTAQRAQEARDRARSRDRADGNALGPTDTTFAVERGVVLDVSSISANITVRGWSRNEMQVRSDAGSRITVSGGSHTVRVQLGPEGRRRDDDGEIEIQVPKGTRVSASTRQGNVHVSDVGGAVDADVISGDVTISGSVERANVSIAAGDVHVSDADGRVHVNAISGDVLLENIRGDVEVSATSSDVTMKQVRSSRVTAELVSGSVSFDGDLADNGRYEFSSHSGDVQLHLADKAKGTLDLQSFNGDLHTSIPMTTTGNAPRALLQGSRNGRPSVLRGPQHFEFGGGGSAQVLVSTFSGDVHIDRGSRRNN